MFTLLFSEANLRLRAMTIVPYLYSIPIDTSDEGNMIMAYDKGILLWHDKGILLWHDKGILLWHDKGNIMGMY